MRLESYPKILQVGDPLIKQLFEDEVIVEEKIDGSQFRAWFDSEGKAKFGSKAVNYNEFNPPDKMFLPAILSAEKHFAEKNFTDAFFVFEFLGKPKQNTLTYSRAPKDFLVLLDANVKGTWLSRQKKEELASELGLECVPLLHVGKVKDNEELKTFLERESFLGGTTVEGIVVKNYQKLHDIAFMLGAPLFGKFVREEFRELNRENWGTGVPIEEKIMKHFPPEPRWRKAVQHLREQGQLGNGVKDIGKLIVEVERDFEEECKEAVKGILWEEYAHRLVTASRAGFAEWFKQELAKQAFEESR